MLFQHPTILATFAVLFFVSIARADGPYVETVHAAVVFARHGEQTPFIIPSPSVLTPSGALQLQAAGSQLRARYIDRSGVFSNASSTRSAIAGISTRELNITQLFTLTGREHYLSSSLQAIFQGLYPPANVTSPSSTFANGSVVSAPLGGYQYPQISTVSGLDPNRIWIMGNALCPQYLISGADYFRTPDFTKTLGETRTSYNDLAPVVLNGNVDPTAVGYYNAFDVFDFVSYGVNHDRSVNANVSASDLTRLRILADKREWAMNGNISASGLTTGDSIRAVAGRTLAARIASLLKDNVESSGDSPKLSVMVGTHEPFLSFFGLSRLPSINADFYGIPSHGASMVFELFSVGNATSSYPAESDLKVRFLFDNGTDSDGSPQSYPLFGRGPSQTDMSWADFAAGMEAIMLPNVADWCHICGSSAYYCGLYDPRYGQNGAGGSGGSRLADGKRRGVSAPVAGVIGAATTIGTLLLVILGAVLLFGVRLHRTPARFSGTTAIAKLGRRGTGGGGGGGGFKGGEKLASDADLTLKDAAAPPAGAGATVVAPEGRRSHEGVGVAIGHERTGSWELKDHAATLSTPGAKGQRALSSASLGSSLDHDGSAHPGRRLDDREDDRVDPFSDPVWVQDRV